ncbi:hypothetical protein PAEPH01_0988 [Pancytospora epiphaga]|nr:hypothetical protein PAEPH01_0988 [Pancytospora epiphaga]
MAYQNESSEDMSLPEDHNSLCRFIADNKEKILKDWRLVVKILGTLDRLLINAENMSDLQRDTSIILETIKLQQDALLREYRDNLSIEQLAVHSNQGVLDEFFEMVKLKSLAVKFTDQVSLSFTPKVKEPRGCYTKTVYDVCNGPARTPEGAEGVSEVNEQAILVKRIKDVVFQHGRVEYFHLIINPDSYSKTVYNAFNLALAVRMKALSLVFEDGQVYVAQYTPGCTDIGHSALHLTNEQVICISKKLGIKESLL